MDPSPERIAKVKIEMDAEARVQKIKKFYKNLASWIGTSIFLVALDFFISGGVSWSKYPVFFWGIALVMQFFKVLPLIKMDRAWEAKMKRKFEETHEYNLPAEEKVPDYSDELLNKKRDEVEMEDLKEYRKLSKPWKDEDLV